MLIGALLLLRPITLTAQEVDHLYPEDGDFAHVRFAYFGYVKSILSRGMKDRPLVYAACIPSFHPEWVVYIEQPLRSSDEFFDEDTLTYVVVCEKPVQRIWLTLLDPAPKREQTFEEHDKMVAGIETIVSSRSIPKDIANEVIQAFLAILGETRYSDGALEGIDGTGYHFSAFNRENWLEMYGKAWSPRENSKPAKLVELSWILLGYAESKADTSDESSLRKMSSIARFLLDSD